MFIGWSNNIGLYMSIQGCQALPVCFSALASMHTHSRIGHSGCTICAHIYTCIEISDDQKNDAGVDGLQRGALARFLNRHVSREHATLEVYLSHGLAVTSILGPVARAATASPRLTAQSAKHEQHDRRGCHADNLPSCAEIITCSWMTCVLSHSMHRNHRAWRICLSRPAILPKHLPCLPDPHA